MKLTIILKKELIVIKIYNIYLSKESHNIRSNNENDIDIILIESKLAFKNKHFIINNLDDKNKYNDSFIVFSSPLNSPIIDVEKNKYIHSIVNNDINDLIQETNDFINYLLFLEIDHKGYNLIKCQSILLIYKFLLYDTVCLNKHLFLS